MEKLYEIEVKFLPFSMTFKKVVGSQYTQIYTIYMLFTQILNRMLYIYKF